MSYGLKDLAMDWGYDEDVFALLENHALDSLVPSICTVCGYTTEYESDQDRGWCEECDKGTVKSCLILAGWI